ncbi:MAG TPA: polyribonucleotide nucleotidyltransferase [Candidatus Caccopulliclostridium gallistercoris]|uniref:Polyribonucleotide nucleotidyltransferase n=1 Tax=Candidatus Caccopulliclostridium gallistercoris TaxID=2840719 RepID=A0A9D1NEG0_9FIRM|nr:polyribonucleotide nucleotidyltransferase [Candidatus Caccopulliclostridium gallistercoris]
MENHIFETEIGGKKVTVETGRYCEQADGTCWVKCGETVIMVNVTMAEQPRPGIDFFPLGVDFEEKMYSVGKIPGGFKKREGRPSDKAILTSRLIDRPLRPLFPKGFFNDVSVVATALSIDPDVAPEPLAMLGSSFALTISGIPFAGPTGSVNVALIDGKYIANPNNEEREKSRMSLTVSGTRDAVLMVEAGAKEVTEEEMLGGIMFAHDIIKKLVDFQLKAKEEIGKAPKEVEYYVIDKELEDAVRAYASEKLDYALDTFDRQERQTRQDEVDKDVKEHFAETFPEKEREIGDVLYKMTKEKVRAKILNKGIRPDGRKLTDIRPIWCDAGVLPRVHGTGVFTRGQTQVLTTLTLGTISDAQKLEGLDDEEVKRYVHHYNMPPYSTGEARQLKSPGRREIGHGALAERALEPVIPSEEEFPYALRLVSEVLSSNGSSSMASVCGSTLALMDGGVQIKAPVAGIAMGLIKDDESGKVAVLSDIQGLEDFLGDMDFKVAGTTKGITAIQMDIKIKGIDENILRTALEQARQGRLYILDKMLAVIDKPRAEISKYAPKIITFTINPDKIKDVIGSGGKTINNIIEETGVKIDIEDDGQVFIATPDSDMAEKAKQIILNIAEDLEVGKIYSGKVARIMNFGAFVDIAPGKEGMIHISKLSSKRVEKVEDVVNIGDEVEVEVIKIDNKGRVDLKLVAVSK